MSDVANYPDVRIRNPFLAGLAKGFKPRKRLSLSQWAEDHIVLPEERSASPGPYRIGDASYQRGMMDAVTNPDCDNVILLTSTQVGKTTVLSAAQGFYAEHEPCPQLSAWPTDKAAKKYYDETFVNLVRDADSLGRVMDGTDYPGGYIVFVGANNPTDLRSRPVRVVTCDEIDAWKLSSGKDGDPVVLIKKRQETFRNAKGVWCSTPLLLKSSRITTMFQLSRQHYFHVVCPHCDHDQVLRWQDEDGSPRVIYTKGNEDAAAYLCANPSCGTLWSEVLKRRLVRDAEKMGGGWRMTNPSPFKIFRSEAIPSKRDWGFWVNAIYSPYSSMARMAQAETDAGENPEQRKTFVTTYCGLPWKGDASSFADAELLQNRREAYNPLLCPKGAALITAAVDVQDDRLECLATAWGSGEESWILNHEVVPIDPSTPQAWQYVTEFLSRRYLHPAGRTLGIEAACVDSGGHFTQKVYAYCTMQEKRGNRVHAIKGVGGEGRPIWSLSQQKVGKGGKLYIVGVDDAKTTIYQRYTIASGPGMIHLHAGITDGQTKQMTAEHCEGDVDKNGFPTRVWVKNRMERNEMLDLEVYNLAARSSINIDIDARLKSLNAPAAKKAPTMEELGEDYRKR